MKQINPRKLKKNIEMIYKYPNLGLECDYITHGHISTYANYAGMSTELFERLLSGFGQFTQENATAIQRLTGEKTEYLFSKHLSYYDMNRPKHYKKIVGKYYEYLRLVNLYGEDDLYFRHREWFEGSLSRTNIISRAEFNLLLGCLKYIKSQKNDLNIICAEALYTYQERSQIKKYAAIL